MTNSQWPTGRTRSESSLTAVEAAACRANGIELGFDPVQQSIVPVHCIDDIVDNPLGAAITIISPSPRHPPISFRRWREQDVEIFAALLGNERVWKYMPDARPSLDPSSAIDLIRFSNEADHHDVYAVEVAGEVVGQARLLFDLNASVREVAEISYWLGEPYWGKGIGTLLVQEFTRASFSRWESLSSILARVHSDNHASRRALTKASYVPQEGQSVAQWQVLTRSRS